MPVPVEDFDVVGAYNNQRVLSIDPERSVNMLMYLDPLGKKPKSLLHTSGLLRTTSNFGVSTGGARATFVFQGVGLNQENYMYQVFGLDVYRIDNNENAVLIFSFTSSSSIGYVGVDANTYQVIFVDGQQGWIWDTVTETATQITDPAFPVRPIDVCNLDGFFVVANGMTNNFQLSSFNNGLIWGVTPATTFTDPGFPTANLLLSGNLANFQIGTTVTLTTTGTLPAPLQPLTTYYVVAHPGGNNIQISDTNGGTAIIMTDAGVGVHSISNNGQLQQASITSHPGNIVACRTLHRRLFLFSLNFIEVWENQGIGANLPFRRINSILIENGTPAIGSIANAIDKMFYLAQDPGGLSSVMMIDGMNSVPISTRALDFQLAQYAELDLISDARGFLIKENGLMFYRINFNGVDQGKGHTFVFNATLSDPSSDDGKIWHEEEVLNGDRHWSQTHAYFNGSNYVADYRLPRMYTVDSSFLTNDGEAIRRMRITRPVVPPGYQRIRIDRFQLDLLQGSPFADEILIEPITLFTEAGEPILTEDDLELFAEQESRVSLTNDGIPLVYLSISKDGGQTFGYLNPAPMGKSGQRSVRTVWRKLGVIPRGQGFVVKIEFFDNYPFTILGGAWGKEVLPE